MKSFPVVCTLMGLGFVGFVTPATSGSSAPRPSPQEAPASRRILLATLEEGTKPSPIENLGPPVTLDGGATATLVGTTNAWRTLKKNETIETTCRLRIDFDVRASATLEGDLPHVHIHLSDEDITNLTQFLDSFSSVERTPPDPIVSYDFLDASWGDLDFRFTAGALLISWQGFSLPGKGWLPINLAAFRKALSDGRATLEKLKAAKPSARF